MRIILTLTREQLHEAILEKINVDHTISRDVSFDIAKFKITELADADSDYAIDNGLTIELSKIEYGNGEKS